MSTTAVKYPHIEKPADGPARFESHPRMRVSHIIGSFFAHGWSPAEMCRQYPFLKIAEVHAAMAYYYDNREEIEQELEEDLRLFDSYRELDSDSPFKRRMKAEGRL